MTKARSNAVAEAAKGDLSVGSGTNLAGILAVGNNGETLVADSSTSTGLRYNPQNALANPIINGGMDIWQRGTSIACGAAQVYTADRWYGYRGALATGQTVSRQAANDPSTLPNIQYCARVQRDSGNTSTQGLNLQYSIESSNSIPFAGRAVTFSFYARKGANFSFSGDSLTYNFYSGTGTDQNIGGSYTGLVTIGTAGATLTTSWQRFVLTGTVPTNATEMALAFGGAPTGTAGANDYFEITGVQIDIGTYTASTAPAFRRSGGTLQGELAACQRYYEVGRKEIWSGNTTNATNYYGNVRFTVTKRTTSPTITQVSTYLSGFPSITINEIGAQSFRIQGTANTTMSGAAFSLEEWNASAEL